VLIRPKKDLYFRGIKHEIVDIGPYELDVFANLLEERNIKYKIFDKNEKLKY